MIGADDAEAVIGVVAAEAELDHRAALDLDLRRREREPLGRHLDDLSILRGSGRRCDEDEQRCRGERAEADAADALHQNHQPSPTFRLSTLPTTRSIADDRV